MSSELDSMEEQEGNETSVYSSPPPYLPDQRVLCSDVNNDKHFYEAVVRKVKCVSENEWSFFVHYQGWNSRWDRWVSKQALLQDTPENRKLYLKAKEPTKKRKAVETSTSAGRKRKSGDNGVARAMKYDEYCELPFTLRTLLVDEHAYITRKGFDSPQYYDSEPSPRPARSVHELPAAVPVRQVLQHYLRKRGGSSEDKAKQQEVRKFCQGFALLFDDALPRCLLYPQERPQYESLRRDENLKRKRPCEIYGCEFLLRLFVRLPVLLQGEPKSEMDTMGPQLLDLLVLLQKNRQACFKPRYREPKYDELLDWEKALANADQATKEETRPGLEQSTSQLMET